MFMRMAARKRDTRQRLIEVATRLFRRNGYAATGLDEICSTAGVTKGAFFHYFKGKETLAEACLTAWGEAGVNVTWPTKTKHGQPVTLTPTANLYEDRTAAEAATASTCKVPVATSSFGDWLNDR